MEMILEKGMLALFTVMGHRVCLLTISYCTESLDVERRESPSLSRPGLRF